MRFSPKITVAITAAFTLAAFSFTACRMHKDTDDGEDTGYGSDHALLEKNYSDVQSIADEASDNNGSLATYKMIGGGGTTILSQCATVTIDTTVTPHTMTIDFGTSNCLCKDGVYRRGQIIVAYTGRYRDMGHVHTITFNNYFANDNQITGTKTVTYSSNDAAGNPKYDISVTGAIILANGGGTISWTSTRTRIWTAGYATKDWSDDEYDVTGSGNVTRANGKTFTLQILTPLHRALSCRWIGSGTVQITPTGVTGTRTLDYGTGACDAEATYTVNGKTYNITLK